MPGLLNLHVHLPASGSPKKQGNPRKLVKFMTSMALTRRIALAMCEGYAKTQLLSGVTTIRISGVFVWQTVTVAFSHRSSMDTGRPTTGERPLTTACLPQESLP